MKKSLSRVVTLSLLLVSLCLYAFAAEDKTDGVSSLPSSPVVSVVPCQSPQIVLTSNGPVLPTFPGDAVLSADHLITVNCIPLPHPSTKVYIENTLYVTAVPVLKGILPSVEIDTKNGTMTASSPGFSLIASEGNCYLCANGRYLYAPVPIFSQNGEVLLPVDALAQALGCTAWDEGPNGTLSFQKNSSFISAQSYPTEDLFWLSHAIHSESGNQPMKGRIAVGTVILNRVANERFPNTIQEVIFSPGQFSPVANGSIYNAPDQESIIAAMLCLDGVREAETCLYFNVTTMDSWADDTRNYVCTIGGHNFYE